MSQVSIIDIEGNHPQIPTRFDANVGFAVPIGNVLEILGDTVAAGTTPVQTVGSGNTITTNVQISQAIASTNASNIGLAAFDSAAFSVDANGFVTLNGGGGATTNIDVDASTAPGTDPVLPNGMGNITITGAQVAAGVVGTSVIRTNSLAANTLTVQIQRTTSTGVSTVASNGVAHFNSAEFNVDGNGFVSLAGGGLAIDSIGVQTGTSPIVPTGGGLVTINGATVAAGTNPVRTDGTGANTMAVEIQISQAIAASNATNIGLSAFNSAHFSVDANGFVSLLGGGEAIDSIGVDATSGGGTNPVLPTALGIITVNGAVVASGTNPLRTVSTAANVYQIQVQTSQALAAADATKIGLSNFSSTDFAVTATGFVTLSTTGAAKTITGNSGGALSPTANNWNILAAVVAAGTTPATTVGSGSTLTVNIQRTQAIASTNASNVGLAAFDSAAFDVDANGFVQLNGGGIASTSFAVQANTAPGTNPVVPTAAGLITINGAAVANHSVVLESRSRAANAYNLEIQYATTAAATDATKSGVAHFDSTDFTVDANGFVALAGAGAGQTITGDTGGALPPSGGNWNIVGGAALSAGTNASVTSGTGSTLTVTSINCAKWIVDATANRGTHTTIAGAIAAASSGETIFIRPGTYTENLTLKAGVDLVSFSCEGETPNVTIIGNATFTAAGTVTIAGIRLQTNSASFLTVSGSAASLVYLDNCMLNCSNNTGISFSSSSSSAQIWVRYCRGNIATTGISLWSMTSAGNLAFSFCEVMNTGASTTASTNSSGTVQITNSNIGVAISSSGTGGLAFTFSLLGSGTNTTAITHNGSGTGICYNCTVSSGSASTISIGTGATMAVTSSTIISSNTNAITGAGTVVIAGISFSGASSLINTTTQTLGAIAGAEYRGRSGAVVSSAGMLGEFISAGANAVAIANATAKTIASMVLTPGTWLVNGMGFILNSGIVTSQSLGISTTNNTMPAGTAGVNFSQMLPAGGTATSWGNTLNLVPLVQYVASNTTYYIVAVSNFTTGTGAANAFMTAIRIA